MDAFQKLYESGCAMLNAELYLQAVTEFTIAIKAGIKNAALFNKRSVAYFYLKKYPNALKDFNEAIRLDPDNEDYKEALRSITR